MPQAVQFATTGGPDVLELVDVDKTAPGPGEVRIANAAVGLNFIDIYFRTGLYPTDLPSGSDRKAPAPSTPSAKG